MCHFIVFVADGPLKRLYERIRSQRENWQQRSLLHESHEIDAAADGSRSAAAVRQGVSEFVSLVRGLFDK